MAMRCGQETVWEVNDLAPPLGRAGAMAYVQRCGPNPVCAALWLQWRSNMRCKTNENNTFWIRVSLTNIIMTNWICMRLGLQTNVAYALVLTPIDMSFTGLRSWVRSGREGVNKLNHPSRSHSLWTHLEGKPGKHNETHGNSEHGSVGTRSSKVQGC